MKTLLFDYDGTIGDTYGLMISCVNQLSTKYHYSTVTNSVEWKNKTLKQALTEDLHIKRYTLPFYTRAIKKLFKLHIQDVECFPGIKEMLHTLAQHFSLSILSSNAREVIVWFLAKNGIPVFQHIHSDSSLFGKDKTIMRFIRKYWLEKQDVIYVWDEVRDILACKKIWIPIIAVTRWWNSKKILEQYSPDYLVDDPGEILKVVQGL